MPRPAAEAGPPSRGPAPPAAACSTPRSRSSSTAASGTTARTPVTSPRSGCRPRGTIRRSRRQGFGLQEVELAAQSAIDPYLEGAVFLTIPNLEGLEVEEAYLVTTSLPLNLQIKAGTFRSQFGRNNTQHLHLQYFTRRPLMTALLFGAGRVPRAGRAGVGAAAPALVRDPLRRGVQHRARPTIRPASSTFGGGVRLTPPNLTYTAVLEQFLELAESHSLLLGLNFATGRSVDCVTAAPCEPASPSRVRAPTSTARTSTTSGSRPTSPRATPAFSGPPSSTRARWPTGGPPKGPATARRSCRSPGACSSAAGST